MRLCVKYKTRTLILYSSCCIYRTKRKFHNCTAAKSKRRTRLHLSHEQHSYVACTTNVKSEPRGHESRGYMYVYMYMCSQHCAALVAHAYYSVAGFIWDQQAFLEIVILRSPRRILLFSTLLYIYQFG